MAENMESKIIDRIQSSSGYEELSEIFRGADKTPGVIEAALNKNGLMLEFVEKQTPEFCMKAVLEDGGALKYVKEQTTEICLEAVKQDPFALKYVKEQTPEIIIAALEKNILAINQVKDLQLKEQMEQWISNKNSLVGQYIEENEGLSQGFDVVSSYTIDENELAFHQAQQEADEAFWKSLQAVEYMSDSVSMEEIDFPGLESAERDLDEYYLQMEEEKKKKQKGLLHNQGVPGFSDLEKAEKQRDDIFMRMYLHEKSLQSGDNYKHAKKTDMEAANSEVLNDSLEILCQKYLEYCMEQGIPEEVLILMNQPGLSLSQMMQIKFGYEDELEFSEIAKYAHPEISRSHMVIARFELLRARRLGIEWNIEIPNQTKENADLDSKKDQTITTGVRTNTPVKKQSFELQASGISDKDVENKKGKQVEKGKVPLDTKIAGASDKNKKGKKIKEGSNGKGNHEAEKRPDTAEKTKDTGASENMIKYAKSIAKELNIPVPDFTNRKETSEFINIHKDELKKHKENHNVSNENKNGIKEDTMTEPHSKPLDSSGKDSKNTKVNSEKKQNLDSKIAGASKNVMKNNKNTEEKDISKEER